MSLVNLSGSSGLRPTFFELYAADKFAPTLKSALIYALSVSGQRRQRFAQLVEYEEEVYGVVMFFLEYFSLQTKGASFAESIYGLRRADIKGRTINRKQRAASLIALVLLPYFRGKLDRCYQNLRGGGIEGHTHESRYTRVLRWLRQMFVQTYPTVDSIISLIEFAHKLSYLLEEANNYSITWRYIGLRVLRVSPQFTEEIKRRLQWKRSAQIRTALGTGLYPLNQVHAALIKGSHFIVDNSRNALIFLLMAFKLLEWWYETGEKQLGDAQAPIPPPPPPPLIPFENQMSIVDPNSCRICGNVRTNPAQLTTSGFVFCYACIYEFVRDNKKCPVTQQSCDVDQVRRIYLTH